MKMKFAVGRIISALLTVLLLLSLGACDAGKTEEPGKGKWRDSDISGEIKASDDIRLEDDFAAAVNKQWHLNASEGDGAIYEAERSVLKKKMSLISDGKKYGEIGKSLVRYASLAGDWETRNKKGVSPIKPYLEAVFDIGSVEELTAYQKDTKNNPFGLGLLIPIDTMQAPSDPKLYQMFIGPPEYTLGDREQYFSLDADGMAKMDTAARMSEHVLKGLGFDSKRCDQILKGCFRMEKRLASIEDGISEVDMRENVFTLKQCIEKAGEYPLKELSEAWGLSEDAKYYIDSGYTNKLFQFYKEEYLSDIKSMLAVHLILKGAHFLDRETYELEKELEKSRMSEEAEMPPLTETEEEAKILFWDYISPSAFGPIMDRLYLKKYIKEEEIIEWKGIVSDLLSQFEVVFSEEEWMSDEGKAACIEKLKALKLHVVRPSFKLVKHGKKQICTVKDENDFFEAACLSEQVLREHEIYLSKRPYNSKLWDPYDISTTEINAFYMPTTNGIYILAGILEEPIYSPEMPYEEKLGGIGVIVGHEITHGFDKNGAKYNKYGIKEDILSFNDELSFSDRTNYVSSYYSTISPFKGSGDYDGIRVSGEATADMGGLAVTLSLAKNTKDFDYDTYFRHFATVWRQKVSPDIENSYFLYDDHPLSYLRINVGVQQFEEFYECYGITEEDGMYLDRDKRIAVW